MEWYKRLLRPLLFKLKPDKAQVLAEWVFKNRLLWSAMSSFLAVDDDRLHLPLAGINLRSPVGLAPGYDKNCLFLDSMLALGFGYVIGGTVTWEPRIGNPKPWLARYPEQQSLINAMGLPGHGSKQVAQDLSRYKTRNDPILVSIGGLTVDEFLKCHRLLEPLVDGIELNISSPNTEGLRAFQEPSSFTELVERVNEVRRKPLFVKLPPYFNDQEREKILTLARLCVRHDVDGVTTINTRPAQEPALKAGAGGISGKLLFEDAIRVIGDVHTETGGKLKINACGGIFTTEDVVLALQAGANSVQILTGLIYEGPTVVNKINRGLVELMEREQILSLQTLRKRLMDGNVKGGDR